MQDLLLVFYLASLGALAGVLLVGLKQVRFEFAIVFFLIITLFAGLCLKAAIGAMDAWWKLGAVAAVPCLCFVAACRSWSEEATAVGGQSRWSQALFALVLLGFSTGYAFHSDVLMMGFLVGRDEQLAMWPLWLSRTLAMGLVGMGLLLQLSKKSPRRAKSEGR
ncbi:hypothetical protein [Paracidovorax avenae]|uniref:hypothetical protein n=1 Tax=Paracidovorax avenae TaxID=80867 RepID=UPI000D162A22|nr:hypothetical protein [Paracidovorax avenae]AVS83937.1 hypothetical protein C8239_03485 [Paracidovorax avenae]AVS87350.1 hypothetical protein C8238_03020 [Paracidovorax avenae]AVS95087.1 hypothetical protein C8232_01530 [Paracidovorax avenae]AVT01543.1 hypothetical protein C8243_02860 [Paracidovorax avenae]AVT08641.1 hypothetical protein C8242_03350 [Paracidovorax avenae]